MPWVLDAMALVTVFVVTLVAGAGLSLGYFLMSRLLALLSSHPSK